MVRSPLTEYAGSGPLTSLRMVLSMTVTPTSSGRLNTHATFANFELSLKAFCAISLLLNGVALRTVTGATPGWGTGGGGGPHAACLAGGGTDGPTPGCGAPVSFAVPTLFARGLCFGARTGAAFAMVGGDAASSFARLALARFSGTPFGAGLAFCGGGASTAHGS